jgi:phage tail-like protein
MADELKCRTLTSADWENIESLDSGIEGCRWHRIVVDVKEADFPKNSTIRVKCVTSEDAQTWSAVEEIVLLAPDNDALFQRLPPGRYLKLQITLQAGDEQKMPELEQVKIYYPRLSYLRYLPAVYQEDPASKEFLERFLSLFESMLHATETTIDHLPMYVDPAAAPEDFLPWLASWVSLDLYDLLSVAQKRQFILKAIEFYKQKGTVAGLTNLVSFLTGCPCYVKEYMNNVFRSYGMEHLESDDITGVDVHGGWRFARQTSRTLNTADRGLLTKMTAYEGYEDEVHYTLDTSKTGRYAPQVIGLFIFVSCFTLTAFSLQALQKEALKNGKNISTEVWGKLQCLQDQIFPTENLLWEAIQNLIGKDIQLDRDLILKYAGLVPSQQQGLLYNPDQLYKLIHAFLPVFVRVKISIIDMFKEVYPIPENSDHYSDKIRAQWEEQLVLTKIQGDYTDTVGGWKWFLSYQPGIDYEKNAKTVKVEKLDFLQYRTPHSQIGVKLPI